MYILFILTSRKKYNIYLAGTLRTISMEPRGDNTQITRVIKSSFFHCNKPLYVRFRIIIFRDLWHSSASQLQGPWLDPELELLSFWSFACSRCVHVFHYARLLLGVNKCVCMCVYMHGPSQWTGVPFRENSLTLPRIARNDSGSTVKWLLRLNEW